MDAAGNVSSKSVISADVECNLSETQAQHLLHAVRSPILKASDSDPRPTPLANTYSAALEGSVLRRADATRVAPSQILCAAEVCTPSSTPTWGVSVQPHGAYGNSNPSGVNLQEALG